MKITTSIARILVGVLFMFSGIIKSNDPKGTGIKFNEYFDVFASSLQEEQDTFKLSISDNYGTAEQYDYAFTQVDSFKSIEINQSIPRNEVFEGNDTVYGSEFFVVLNGTILYNAFYPLSDSTENPMISVNATTGPNKSLLSKSIELSLSSKHEFAEKIAVHEMVKHDSFLVGFFKGLKEYSLILAIIMCVLEVVLGFAILIGWQPKIMSWAILSVIVFFTFLTWYSAYYNKVTDCGCFGDFIVLEPWTSFTKDVILLVLILFIFYRRKHIIALFSPLFSINAMIVVTLGSSIFAIYCNMFLPAWDFLPYKSGNNIRKMMEVPKGERAIDSSVNVLLYEKDGQIDSFIFPDYPKGKEWKYVDRIDKVIVPAWKSQIHDFGVTQRSELDININDSLLYGKGYYVLIVVDNFDKMHMEAWPYIKTMANEAKKKGIQVYAVTASSLELADEFTTQMELPFRFNNADATLLKTIVRSNPGIMYWHDGIIIDKWSCRSIPSIKKLNKLKNKK
jgi:uncharacterized membrane protein YphA (DoxX/SURF4 family)